MPHSQDVVIKTSRVSAGRSRIYAGSECLAGSDPSHPLRITGAEVLPAHARFTLIGRLLYVTPLPRAALLVNGQPVVESVPVHDGDWLVFGSSAVQIFLPETGGEADGEDEVLFPRAERRAPVIVGRLPNCGLTIDSPMISREHARLLTTDDGVCLEDLQSTNGTFVNGNPVVAPVLLKPGDQVSFATFIYLFTGTALQPLSGGRVRVEARNLTKTVTDRTTRQPRQLLDGIELVIEPGEFVVIFGTSGSGKSTLLDSLNGRRPATAGRVLYNGVDLYDSFAAFRAGIGYVPQQDIVHRKITIRNALRYTARLRLPRDTSTGEIAENIERVLQRVGLLDKVNLAVDTPEPLSGGQLKRVNLAVELVANPHVLFLDEATSGLDAGTDKKMMSLFAELAADGKTVICVTHTLENVANYCHLVALLHQGVLVYYGPPKDVPNYFGIDRISDVYEHLDGQDAQYWGQRFRASDHYDRFVQSRLSADLAPRRDADYPRAKSAVTAARSRWFDPRQTWTLTCRYLDLLRSDRLNLAVLLLQAPLIALVVGGIFDTSGTPLERAQTHGQITFVLVLSAIWFGGINSCREIVKELPVYLRERAVVLRIPAYMLSKLLPLAALCAIQCLSFLAIVTLMIDFPGPFLERLLTLFLAGLAATGMGLAVSAFVATNDKAIAALPLLLIPQFILSNAVVPLSGVALAFAKVAVIAYWALDAMHATLEASVLALRAPDGSAIITVNGEWESDCLAIGALTLGFLLIAVVGLKLRDRKV